ncbi:MAG: glycosyltransferase [Betaproteobacteria bacterium]|nr:glycosyltransferase [Betaproteobacteria bacterium]
MPTSAPTAESSLRILHVVDSLERGGLERVVTDLAILQHQQGHDVAVFSIQHPGALAPELERAGVPVLLGDKQRSADLNTLRLLRRAIRERRVDVVHAHNFMPTYYLAAAGLGWGGRAASVATCHDMGSRLAQRKLRWIMRWALARMSRVVMVGAQVQARYLEARLVSPAKVECIRNGVTLDRFDHGAHARAEARKRLGLQVEDLVIGSVGRLVELKNHRALIDVLAQLRAEHSQLRLVLVGGGALRQQLEHHARQCGVEAQVTFAGEQPDVAALLPAFDLFALPSTTEGLSVALLEAAASALPIVATAVGGNPEIVEQGRTGLLVPASDDAALAGALRALLADPARRAELGHAARAWVADNASLGSMFASHDRLYRAARSQRRAGDDLYPVRSP